GFGRKGPADAKKTDVNDEISRLPQKNHTIVGTFRKMPVSQRTPQAPHLKKHMRYICGGCFGFMGFLAR
ncbi:MAG: hypothetical protein PHP45_05885, partial [Elusimicrobiales bacterium]|nr:hypothetical protein [Elusimicrobiales bacterium]